MVLSAVFGPVVQAMKGYFRHRGWDAITLLRFRRTPPFVFRHMKMFYFALLCITASSTWGSFLCFTGSNGRCFAAFVAFMCFLAFRLVSPSKRKERLSLLALGAFFGWAAATPSVEWLLNVDNGFVATSHLSTTLVFGCYWLSSIWESNFLNVYYLGLRLCTVVVIGLVAGAALGTFQVWLRPLVLVSFFMWYTPLYSQEVAITARRRTNGDYVVHAIRLFTDVPSFSVNFWKELWRSFAELSAFVLRGDLMRVPGL